MASYFERSRSLRLASCLSLYLTAFAIEAQQKTADDEKNRETSIENLWNINSYQSDYAPQISPNGRYLIFQSNRPGYRNSYNIWMSENKTYHKSKARAAWSKVVPLRFPFPNPVSGAAPPEGVGEKSSFFTINTDAFEGAPALLYRALFPRQIFFTSYRSAQNKRGGFAALNIYHSYYRDQKWQPPIHLSALNSKFNDRMPSLPHQGDILYFSSDRPGGYGGYDIWFSSMDTKGRWQTPRNAGPYVNSAAHESAPSISPDGKLLFFSSDRAGGLGHYDLYFSRAAKGGGWGEARNLGRPFNSRWDDEYFSITQDAHWAYFCSDRKSLQARKDSFDLYRVRLPLWLYHEVDVLFRAQIIDGSSQEILGLEASVSISSAKEAIVRTSKIFHRPYFRSRPVNNFERHLSSGYLYKVRISAPGFLPKELQLDYRAKLPQSKIDSHKIVLYKKRDRGSDSFSGKPGSQGNCIKEELACLQYIRIYFDSDSSRIRQQEREKISALLAILRANPFAHVRIEGHTDSTHTVSYNRRLSLARVKSVLSEIQAMAKNNINLQRFQLQGYGASRPAIAEKTKEDRAKNRRVEFALIQP